MSIEEKERIVQRNVLEIFKENFTVNRTIDEILNTCPEKEFNTNYIQYYESILDIFLIDSEHMNSITGKVSETVSTVARLWSLTPHYVSI